MMVLGLLFVYHEVHLEGYKCFLLKQAEFLLTFSLELL